MTKPTDPIMKAFEGLADSLRESHKKREQIRVMEENQLEEMQERCDRLEAIVEMILPFAPMWITDDVIEYVRTKQRTSPYAVELVRAKIARLRNLVMLDALTASGKISPLL